MYQWYTNTHGSRGVQCYAINLLLYIRTIKDKYVQMYKIFIKQLHMHAEVAKGYLPILLVTPLKLKEILDSKNHNKKKTNPDYDIVIKKLHLYYDMKLVTFSKNRDKNLKIQFPVFIQP